jgi:hypothetical protein
MAIIEAVADPIPNIYNSSIELLHSNNNNNNNNSIHFRPNGHHLQYPQLLHRYFLDFHRLRHFDYSDGSAVGKEFKPFGYVLHLDPLSDL